MYLPRSIYDSIIAHAREGAPHEVCGLLRGRDGVVSDWHPATNIAADPGNDYEIAAEELLAAFEWEDAGDELIAIYHSHPTGPAYPSATDAWRLSYPDSATLICSLQDPIHPQLRGYYLRQQQLPPDPARVRAELSFQQERPGLWSVHIPALTPVPPSLQSVMPAPPAALYVLYQQSAPSPLRMVIVEPVEINVGNLS
ncbi:MAG: M67 family metallopeptidase [Chloroflexi bacterium]|nr:M67 family metallopeptidase [Chloroflexota bacterium]